MTASVIGATKAVPASVHEGFDSNVPAPVGPWHSPALTHRSSRSHRPARLGRDGRCLGLGQVHVRHREAHRRVARRAELGTQAGWLLRRAWGRARGWRGL